MIMKMVMMLMNFDNNIADTDADHGGDLDKSDVHIEGSCHLHVNGRSHRLQLKFSIA